MPDNPREVVDRIATHVEEILKLLGLGSQSDPELVGTARRVADLAIDLTSGMGEPDPVEFLPDEAAGRGLIIAQGLPFHSLCAHHLLPFFGFAHIGYLPGAGVVGIGTLGRILDHYARRPQLQERLGEQIATFLISQAGAQGAIVVLEARQLCMEMRGGRKTGFIQSTAARGDLSGGAQRAEFFQRITLNFRGANG